jgi:hypothetical protein
MPRVKKILKWILSVLGVLLGALALFLLFSYLRPYAFVNYALDRDGELVNQRLGPGVYFQGKRNLGGFIGVNIDRVRTADAILSRRQVPFQIQVDPTRRFPRLTLSGFLGEDTDVVNVRVGSGGDLTAEATLRPDDHLDIRLNSALSWLNVANGAGSKRRLFTAQVQRLRAIYHLGPRMFLRLIGQYVTIERDPSLYSVPIPERSAFFTGSLLFSYRLNWQTALFLGYGDDRERSPADRLERTGRQLFLKLSYSFRR